MRDSLLLSTTSCCSSFFDRGENDEEEEKDKESPIATTIYYGEEVLDPGSVLEFWKSNNSWGYHVKSATRYPARITI